MVKEFWEIFLPQDIVVRASRMDGKKGTAEIKFNYYGFNEPLHTAKFLRDFMGNWHLEEIV